MPEMPRRRCSVLASRNASKKKCNQRRKTEEPSTDQAAKSLCRVCMRWCSASLSMSRMVGLFDRQVQGMKLAELLSLVGAVAVPTEGDHLPNRCCKKCLKELEQAYKTRLLCQDSDRKLRDMFADGEPVAVKVEFDADELNPLEDMVVECEPNVDKMLKVEEVGVVSEVIALPKLEILKDNTAQREDQKMLEEDDTTEGLGCEDAESNEDGEDVSQEEQKTEQTEEDNKPRKFLIPGVFDEVPVVGFRCCGCKNKFDTIKDLKAHALTAHFHKKLPKEQLEKRMQCDICFRVLRSSFALKNHKTIDTVNFRCKACGDLFRSRRRVCLHHERIHGRNPTISGPSKICCGCSERFETDEQLKEHSVTVHLPEKPPPEPTRPFICNVCYRNYPTDRHLYGHQSRMLKATKNHMCVECGLRFKHPGLLRDHEITHTGERAFKCSECPATYNSKESYRKHIKLHSDPANKYKCDICGCSYRHAKGLKEHITAEHTGERPHKCPHCPASYARTSGLSSHLLSHSVQKLHRCPLCGKEFKRFSECKQHVNFFHHKLKPFPCFFCPRQYPRKDYRKRHMVSAHAEELRNNPLPPVELFGNPRWNELKANAVPPVQTLSST